MEEKEEKEGLVFEAKDSSPPDLGSSSLIPSFFPCKVGLPLKRKQFLGSWPENKGKRKFDSMLKR